MLQIEDIHIGDKLQNIHTGCIIRVEAIKEIAERLRPTVSKTLGRAAQYYPGAIRKTKCLVGTILKPGAMGHERGVKLKISDLSVWKRHQCFPHEVYPVELFTSISYTCIACNRTFTEEEAKKFCMIVEKPKGDL